MAYCCRHREPATRWSGPAVGARVLGSPAHASHSKRRLRPTARQKAVADTAQCSQGDGGEQPNAAEKTARTASPTRSRRTKRSRLRTSSCATRRTTATSKTPAAAPTSGTRSSTFPCAGRDDWYLSIGGEVRERYEFYPQSERRVRARQRQGQQPGPPRALPAARRPPPRPVFPLLRTTRDRPGGAGASAGRGPTLTETLRPSSGVRRFHPASRRREGYAHRPARSPGV